MKVTIKIPVVYTGHVGRSKVDKTVVSCVDHTAEIPEFSDNDAPIALRSVVSGSVFHFVDYRLLNGQLYRRLCRPNTDGAHQVQNRIQVIERDIWTAMADEVKVRPGSTLPPRPRFIPLPKIGGFDELAAELISETKAVIPATTADVEISDWRGRADAIFARSIFVEGRLYELSHEPQYMVSMNKPRQIDWATPTNGSPYDDILKRYRSAEIRENDRMQSAAYFNADQFELAREFLDSRKATNEVREPKAIIERWSNDYQCDDTDALELGRAARLLLNDVSWGIWLRSRARPTLLEDDMGDVVRAVMHLQSLVNAYDPDDDMDIGLDDAMTELVETAENRARSRPLLTPHIRDLASYTVGRWQGRPIRSPSIKALGCSI